MQVQQIYKQIAYFSQDHPKENKQHKTHSFKMMFKDARLNICVVDASTLHNVGLVLDIYSDSIDYVDIYYSHTASYVQFILHNMSRENRIGGVRC